MPLLPQPLPDELLSSVIARGARENRLSSKRQIQDAFGDNRSYRSFLFGSSLKRIGLLSGKAPDQLLQENTVFPYATAFMSESERLKLHQIALDPHARSRMNFVASRVSVGRPFRMVCLECIEQDQRELGISYWRVSHQLPLSYFCLSHLTALRESLIPLRGNANCSDMTLPHEASLKPKCLGTREILQMELTKSAVRVQRYGASVPWSYAGYRRKARELGFVRASGDLAARALSTEFASFYGPDYLKSMECELPPKSAWPALLCSETKQLEASTTKHLLLSSFLQLYKRTQERKLTHYKPRQRRAIDYCALDLRISQQLESNLQANPLLNIGFTVVDALNQVGAKSLYSHHRDRLPLTASWVEKLKNIKRQKHIE